MPHRYTIKELKEWNDYEMLFMVVTDRIEGLANPYSPLNKRLGELQVKLSKREQLEK